MDYFALIGLFW